MECVPSKKKKQESLSCGNQWPSGGVFSCDLPPVFSRALALAFSIIDSDRIVERGGWLKTHLVNLSQLPLHDYLTCHDQRIMTQVGKLVSREFYMLTYE